MIVPICLDSASYTTVVPRSRLLLIVGWRRFFHLPCLFRRVPLPVLIPTKKKASNPTFNFFQPGVFNLQAYSLVCSSFHLLQPLLSVSNESLLPGRLPPSMRSGVIRARVASEHWLFNQFLYHGRGTMVPLVLNRSSVTLFLFLILF